MAHNVLLIGGHGKIAQLLTPLLLARSWNVTSMIRSADQTATIEKLGQGQPGKLSVLVSSVEDVQTESDAQKILDQVKPDWVVWSAGAGGRGGPSRTKAVDQDAAVAFTKASIHAPSIKKFLTVSYIASRRNRAPWWTDADWEAAQKVNNEILPHYYKAKVAADEVLTVLAKERFDAEAKKGVPENDRFAGISLRPGTLTDKSAGGVIVGRIPSRGDTSRATVAETVVAVLETEGARGYIDVLDGDEDTGGAIKRLVKEGIDNVEGEDFENQEKRASQL
ncbi:hypothetical protein PMIN02_000108 [Paraphaeosphaeria minitans]